MREMVTRVLYCLKLVANHCQRPALAAAAFCLLLFRANHVLAQTPGQEPETKEAWVISYALVILSVGLGLYVICRPARRNKEVKQEPK